MEKLKKKMNANDRIIFSRNTILEDQMFTIAVGMKNIVILGYVLLYVCFSQGFTNIQGMTLLLPNTAVMARRTC